MGRWTGRARRWAPHTLTVVAVLAAVLLSVGGIASQLAGRTVLADTDAMVARGEYANAGYAGSTSKNVEFADVYTAELPSTIVFKQALQSGQVAQWNPYVVGGTPLGGIPNNALLSPVSLPNYVLPSWLGPAYERLAELIVGLAGSFLLLRRLGLRRPSAIAGGMVYVASGFMVTWMGWPQTRVAAFIPLLFWAAEKLIQERRFRDSAVLALVTGGFLLGGFPAVEGFALLTLGCYALVRLLAQRREGGLRRLVGTGAGLGFGVAAGFGLAVFQLLPFAKFYGSWVIEGRGQEVSYHLSPTALVTSFAPWALGGTDSEASPRFFLGMNPVEAMSYVGAAAVVLVVVGAACWRRGRALMPPGAWIFFVAATVAWFDLVYWGGAPLEVLQDTPLLRSLFGANFIGRARSMTGFLVAVLAAVGLELILRRREQLPPVGDSALARWFPRAWAAAVTATVVAGSAWLVVQGHDLAVQTGATQSFDGVTKAVVGYDAAVRDGVVIALVAALCVGVVWYVSARGTRQTGWLLARGGAASVVLFLIAGQGASWVHQYSPAAPKSTFYPVTDTQKFLAANLGHQRLASTAAASPLGTESAYRIRTLNGHSFLSSSLAAMVRAIPGNPTPTPTQLSFTDDVTQATSPVLDRLGVAYFAASPQEQVFGTVVAPAASSGMLMLKPGVPVTAPLPQAGRVRAVRISTGAVPLSLAVSNPKSWVEVTVQDASGTKIADARRITAGIGSDATFDIPVAADGVPDGTALTVTITAHTPEPLPLAATAAGVPVLGEVAGSDDGLRLVFAGSSVVYQRLNALPRIRWASQTQVVSDQASRVQLLASGTLPSDTVLLDKAGPAASGAPADVDVTADGTDSISAKVHASGTGYLVVADALQVGWTVTVDGKDAKLVPADQGVVAVAVPGGQHTVTLQYRSPDHGLGAWITGATGGVLLLGTGLEWWLRRRALTLPGLLGTAWPARRLPGAPGSHDEPGPDVREPALREPEGSGAPSRR